METFGPVMDSADELTLDEQESLVSVWQRRVAERRRAGLIRDVKEARQEFKAGKAPGRIERENDVKGAGFCTIHEG